MRAVSSISVLGICFSACGTEVCRPFPPGAPAVGLVPPADVCSGGTLKIASYRDLGRPANVGPGIATVDDDEVLLGTGDGIWRRPLDGRREWSRSGLEGRQIDGLMTIRGLTGIALAAGQPFYRSGDGGHNWCTGGQAELVGRVQGEEFLPMLLLARQPGPQALGTGVLYALMADYSIVRSTDGGATWPFRFAEPGSRTCVLHVPEWDTDMLYEGCSFGYSGFIQRRNIADRNGPVGDAIHVLDTPDDHFPVAFASTAMKPGVLYVGLFEGGLIRLEGDQWRWIYQYSDIDQTPSWGDATNIGTIWIDPCDPKHLVFGGSAYHNTRIFELYETFDDGLTVAAVLPPAPELSVADIEASALAGPGGKDLLLLVRMGPQAPDSEYRVLLRSHSSN
jgi:hypothetical protein